MKEQKVIKYKSKSKDVKYYQTDTFIYFVLIFMAIMISIFVIFA